MGKSFQKINACYVGNFGENGEKIPQWLRANGGTYSKDMNPDVTHLIATESTFKRNVEAGMYNRLSVYFTYKMVSSLCVNVSHSPSCETDEACQDRLVRLAGGLAHVQNPQTEA